MPDPQATNTTREAIIAVRAPGGQTYGHVVDEERRLAAADAGTPDPVARELAATGLLIAKGAPSMPEQDEKSAREVAEEQGTRVWNQWDDKEAAEARDRAADEIAAGVEGARRTEEEKDAAAAEREQAKTQRDAERSAAETQRQQEKAQREQQRAADKASR